MSEYLKVEGNDGLVRDKESGAILSCSTDDYDTYKRKLNASLQMKAKLQKQEEEIADIKNDISDIKEMLYQLLNAK